MNATTATRKTFVVLGTTDDVTECGLCGRAELKGTIALEYTDADGNGTGEVVYYGMSCGAKAAGWTTREIRQHAKDADQARRDAERAKREAKSRAFCARRDAWVAEHIGRDAFDFPRKYGFSGPFAIVKAYMAATGDQF